LRSGTLSVILIFFYLDLWAYDLRLKEFCVLYSPLSPPSLSFYSESCCAQMSARLSAVVSHIVPVGVAETKELVNVHVKDGIALLQINNPPVNSLSPAVIAV
jgi:hypothetical protein